MSEESKPSELMQLRRMAREIGVNYQWLRQTAEAGKVPCLKVGRRYLFNRQATIQAVAKLAAESRIQNR